jgi:hypothetical protein
MTFHGMFRRFAFVITEVGELCAMRAQSNDLDSLFYTNRQAAHYTSSLKLINFREGIHGS